RESVSEEDCAGVDSNADADGTSSRSRWTGRIEFSPQRHKGTKGDFTLRAFVSFLLAARYRACATRWLRKSLLLPLTSTAAASFALSGRQPDRGNSTPEPLRLRLELCPLGFR